MFFHSKAATLWHAVSLVLFIWGRWPDVICGDQCAQPNKGSVSGWVIKCWAGIGGQKQVCVLSVWVMEWGRGRGCEMNPNLLKFFLKLTKFSYEFCSVLVQIQAFAHSSVFVVEYELLSYPTNIYVGFIPSSQNRNSWVVVFSLRFFQRFSLEFCFFFTNLSYLKCQFCFTFCKTT